MYGYAQNIGVPVYTNKDLSEARRATTAADEAYANDHTQNNRQAVLRAQRRMYAIYSRLAREVYATPVANMKRVRQLQQRLLQNRRLDHYKSDYDYNRAHQRIQDAYRSNNNMYILYVEQMLGEYDKDIHGSKRQYDNAKAELGYLPSGKYKHVTFNYDTLEWE